MANKEKKIISNNLLKIREELNYTQQELGQILDVSERMICYYETGLSSLPIDKAVLIRKKWNYSLDWIYNQDLSGKFHDVSEETPDFLVDIRRFLKVSDDKVVFSIPQDFWNYMSDLNEICHSTVSENERKRKIVELNGSYTKDNKTNIFKECSIDKEAFINMICLGDVPVLYSCEEDKKEYPEPSDEKMKEVIDFLELLKKEEET